MKPTTAAKLIGRMGMIADLFSELREAGVALSLSIDTITKQPTGLVPRNEDIPCFHVPSKNGQLHKDFWATAKAMGFTITFKEETDWIRVYGRFKDCLAIVSYIQKEGQPHLAPRGLKGEAGDA